MKKKRKIPKRKGILRAFIKIFEREEAGMAEDGPRVIYVEVAHIQNEV